MQQGDFISTEFHGEISILVWMWAKFLVHQTIIQLMQQKHSVGTEFLGFE